MSKTIKELADENYPCITGELVTYNEKFVEGANAVLEEVVEFLKDCQSFVLETPQYSYFNYKKAIEVLKEQLKGE